MSKDKLVVLWTSSDRGVALNMMFMYIKNAIKQDWWKEVNLIIWGPSAKLAAEDEVILKELQESMDLGITVEACKACASNYDVADKLENLNVDVKYMGKPLTEYIKGQEEVITF